MGNQSFMENNDTVYGQESDLIRAYILRSLEEFHIAGKAVAVVKDNQVIFLESFGLRDVENLLPVMPNTLFAIGSSTKAFKQPNGTYILKRRFD